MACGLSNASLGETVAPKFLNRAGKRLRSADIEFRHAGMTRPKVGTAGNQRIVCSPCLNAMAISKRPALQNV